MPIRVLLVDDAAEIRLLVRTALRVRDLFTVVGEAADGAGAIALAETARPDVVVLDIGLPDLAGQEVLTRIRERAPTAKVVIFSGTHPQDSAGMDQRVDGYALKEPQLDYLLELLERVGRQRTGQTALHLAAVPTSAGQARAFTREALQGWDVDDVVDDALVVVSELVSNAVMHARTDCELRLSVSPVALRVEVLDSGRGTPDPLASSSTRDHGRGLHLIGALAAAWGVEPVDGPVDGPGKMVWAELLRPA